MTTKVKPMSIDEALSDENLKSLLKKIEKRKAKQKVKAKK